MVKLSYTLRVFRQNAKKGAETRRTQGDRELFGSPYGKRMRGTLTTVNGQAYGSGPYGQATSP